MKFLDSSLKEDLGRGDLFKEVFKHSNLDSKKVIKAQILSKENGVFSGLKYAKKLCKRKKIKILESKKDGESFKKNECLMLLKGKYLNVLEIERLLLNILQHSSGIATLTNQFAKKIKNYPCKLLDTRKTRPLLRKLEKYSVVNGGASNHRFGLDSMLMLKDTHLAHIENLKEFIQIARKVLPFGVAIEVEVSNLLEFKKALDSGADIIMLDNMNEKDMKKAISLKQESNVKIELSGNVTLENIENFAALGADAISVGSLIHQARFIDMSMKML